MFDPVARRRLRIAALGFALASAASWALWSRFDRILSAYVYLLDRNGAFLGGCEQYR